MELKTYTYRHCNSQRKPLNIIHITAKSSQEADRIAEAILGRQPYDHSKVEIKPVVGDEDAVK